MTHMTPNFNQRFSHSQSLSENAYQLRSEGGRQSDFINYQRDLDSRAGSVSLKKVSEESQSSAQVRRSFS